MAISVEPQAPDPFSCLSRPYPNYLPNSRVERCSNMVATEIAVDKITA
jgi:hypothetical protein